MFTTEQLKERAKYFREKAVTGETPLHQSIARQYAEAFEELAEARELLANREAQPVGYIAEVSGNRVGVLRGLPLPDVGSLIYTAPPAPAVPEEMTGDGVLSMHDCGYIEGWNARCAAMLAAAPDGCNDA